MKVNVTIPDGPYADALIKEASNRFQSCASLLAAYGRTMLNKYGYQVPGSESSRLHVRARGNGGEQ